MDEELKSTNVADDMKTNVSDDMKKTVRVLKTCFWGIIALAALLAILYESNILLPGGWKLSEQTQFALLSSMELLTLFSIPFALYIFKMKGIKQKLKEQKSTMLLRFGIIRLLMLGVILVVNTLLYYTCGLKVAYGYMAIIVLIVMPFVYPSIDRCKAECGEVSSEE